MTMPHFGNFIYTSLILLFTFISHIYCLNNSSVALNETAYNDDIVFRIVHGRPAKLGDVPYQVSFRTATGYKHYSTFCGGTIVSRNKIISAAHCFVTDSFILSNCLSRGRVSRKKLAKTFAVAGSLKTKEPHGKYGRHHQSTAQWIRLRTGLYPKNYKFPKFDIVVLLTYESFRFNNFVNSIPMASVSRDYKGSCLASGYGMIDKTRQSPILLLADLEMIPSTQCSKMHRQNMRDFICTSTAISDTSQGDSGGPLVCKNTGDKNDRGKGVLVGVVSGARRIGYGKQMSFFTRVTSYKSFINRNQFAPGDSCSPEICKLLILVNCVCFIF